MNWFISEFNILAYQLVKNFKVTKAPDVTLIYGPRGVGKSALLQLLYQFSEIENGKFLTDALLFARQYAYAAQENKLNQFRKRYRSLQLLLIDDLQFMKGKVRTIEELHYTYENIIENGGKLVITMEGDVPALDFLGERLGSRFLGGAVIPINQPQKLELKRFLEDYTRKKRLIIDNQVLKIISEQTDNLQDAKMHIRKFVQYAELQQDELGLTCFQTYWENEDVKKQKAADPINIIQNVSIVMGVPAEEIVSLSRKAKVNEAREMAIYMIRTLCSLSYPAIAHYFNRNHNTIITSYKKMHEKLSKNQELNMKYEIILNTFNPRSLNSDSIRFSD